MKRLFFLSLLWCWGTAWASDQLTLYFIPSPKGMDWSSPRALALSALANRLSFEPRFMGHVFVEFECGGKRELSGMTGKHFDYLRQLLIENRGLGILYHSFEGTLEDQAKISEELKDHLKKGKVNFARFIINQGQCARLTEYLKTYREKNVGRYYGLANRPLYGEGAGCSAFGASFVEVLDLISMDMKNAWTQTINIPLEFAGPPLRDEGVNILKLIFNADHWASEKEPHKKLTFWDPDRMYRWVQERIEKSKAESGFSVLEVEGSKGIVLDKSHFPAPGGPIWQQHLDPSYGKRP